MRDNLSAYEYRKDHDHEPGEGWLASLLLLLTLVVLLGGIVGWIIRAWWLR